MRSSRPCYFDPALVELIYKREHEAEEHARAVRIWTGIGLLFVACVIIERYL